MASQEKQLVTQSSLGSGDSKASLTSVEDESLDSSRRASTGNWLTPSPSGVFVIHPSLANDERLGEFSQAVQSVLKALGGASERMGQAMDEATDWRQRYEQERERTHALEAEVRRLQKALQESSPDGSQQASQSHDGDLTVAAKVRLAGAGIRQSCLEVHGSSGGLALQDGSAGSSAGSAAASEAELAMTGLSAICRGNHLSPHLRQLELGNGGLRGTEADNGQRRGGPQEGEGSKGGESLHSGWAEKVGDGSQQKAVFHLAWAGVSSHKEREKRHRHDVVSFEKGNITSVVPCGKQVTFLWDSPPKTLLLVTKPSAPAAKHLCIMLSSYLLQHRKMTVIVDPDIWEEMKEEGLHDKLPGLQSWRDAKEFKTLQQGIDLLITMGGDGTVLWSASLFEGPVPPVVSFAMGSLGFMTPFQGDKFRQVIEDVISGPMNVTLRHRLNCRIIRRYTPEAETHSAFASPSCPRSPSPCSPTPSSPLPSSSLASASLRSFLRPFSPSRPSPLPPAPYRPLSTSSPAMEVPSISESPQSSSRVFSRTVLNEVAIDRGVSSFLANLEVYCDEAFVTSVQGDGLILSTPSGSTAYSLAAGGSMVHPLVPAILFTPICPHSLSFRPVILPEYVTLRVQVPENTRGQAWVSFDGKDRQQLEAGDALVVKMSPWPVPAVCGRDATKDFLRSVHEGLHWNLRKPQESEEQRQKS